MQLRNEREVKQYRLMETEERVPVPSPLRPRRGKTATASYACIDDEMEMEGKRHRVVCIFWNNNKELAIWK